MDDLMESGVTFTHWLLAIVFTNIIIPKFVVYANNFKFYL